MAARCTVIALFACCGLLGGCSFVSKQVGNTVTSDCIHRDCTKEHGAAYQQCTGECRRRYER